MAIPPRPQLFEDLVLVLQLLPHQIELRRIDLLVAYGRPPGVVCDRSNPQERQNLLASSFWVAAAGNSNINSPKGRGNLGIRRTDVSTRAVPTLSF